MLTIHFDYKKSGENLSVYVFSNSIGTLAHEMYHAKQFEREELFFEGSWFEKFKYKFLGANHKLEKQADKATLEYLKEESADEHKKYKKQIWVKRVGSPIVLLFAVAGLLMLII